MEQTLNLSEFVPAATEPDPQAGIDIFADTDLSFFMDQGCLRLVGAMVKQTCKDIMLDHRDPHAPADVSASARWPRTESGRNIIAFMMPSVSPERFIAEIYRDPQAVFDAIEKAESIHSPREKPVETFALDIPEGQEDHAIHSGQPWSSSDDYGLEMQGQVG